MLLGQDFSFGCYCCCADFAFALLFRGVVAQKSNISERQLNASDSRLFTQNVEFVELEFLLFAKGSSLLAPPTLLVGAGSCSSVSKIRKLGKQMFVALLPLPKCLLKASGMLKFSMKQSIMWAF